MRGHVEPEFANWTTSGEFVFIAVLAGHYSVAAVFVASLLLEIVRSFSSLYFPNTWQLVLGVFLLLVILFRPGYRFVVEASSARPAAIHRWR